MIRPAMVDSRNLLQLLSNKDGFRLKAGMTRGIGMARGFLEGVFGVKHEIGPVFITTGPAPGRLSGHQPAKNTT